MNTFLIWTHRFAQVWAFEDDVGYTGSVADLVKRLRSNRSDLVAWVQQSPVSPSWVWFNCATRRFCRRFAQKRRKKMREHAVRLSHALLETLLAASRRGEIAWSESSIPTLCLASSTLRFTHLRPFVAQGYYNWDTRVEPAEWEELVVSQSPSKKRKLFHALKF